ncbi:hypothetical protein [Pararcticibacter amylolyticus]|uniref:Uncharacterized protein n=1 Tax=Pararcticibacter amylolyticus TaxID=2173175 RepID=A0A2U2PLF5_9SPHI|nr:hypothetical protein [Pararcticibacter amylolyticus]PWG82237.1 hypothetical protein DDR33_04295 [Pararcticibacter amylolyticus]
MKDFDALKDIWSGQVSQPRISYEDIIKGLKLAKRSFSNKLLLETAGMFSAVIILLWVWISNPFMMWTTHLSLLILIVCCLYYVFIQISDYRSITNSESLLQQPEDYIQYLKKYRKRRYILNTRKYSVYSIFIGIAFGLYFIELYFIAPLWQIIGGVAFTAAWFVVCWRLMRTYIRREQEKLYEMIEKLERLQHQFNN